MNRQLERADSDREFGPRRGLWRRIKDIALMDVAVLVKGVDDAALEQLEERLLGADFGVSATLYLVDELNAESKKGKLSSAEDLQAFLTARVEQLLATERGRDLAVAERPPTVVLLVGVNGVGKTTTAARLARMLQAEGHTVLLAAADTFRAGAIEQVEVWGEKLGVPVVSGAAGGDPAAVVFDACDSAVAHKADVLLVDTAGRLHTQDNLMRELTKIRNVVSRKIDGAPHEVLLVLDATTGQNAVNQARAFLEAIDVTGIFLAKLDGTAKGG
ncbi:MAG: signal recognition particle-docking protein FtsY, partial [Gemmatimonadetes bacterium]|nr:signal recognition particle-docking protein FtsY [Gemmatimonadota bacterium]